MQIAIRVFSVSVQCKLEGLFLLWCTYSNTKSTKTHAANENAMQKSRVNRKRRSLASRKRTDTQTRASCVTGNAQQNTFSRNRKIRNRKTTPRARTRKLSSRRAGRTSSRRQIYAKQTFERGRNFFCATYHRTKPASWPAARTPHAKSLLAE